MPKARAKKKPAGFEKLRATFDEIERQLRDAESEPHEGKRKEELLWPIFRLHHQRSRYVYDMFYKQKEISRELYEFLLREKYADKALIAKWKKSGYETLCCMRCIDVTNFKFGGTCTCRVPKKDREQAPNPCVSCGCRGCSH